MEYQGVICFLSCTELCSSIGVKIPLLRKSEAKAEIFGLGFRHGFSGYGAVGTNHRPPKRTTLSSLRIIK